MKNPNGFGTVTKLSGRRRKPWIVKVTVGFDSNGKQIQRSLGTFEDRKTALKCLNVYNANKVRTETGVNCFNSVSDIMTAKAKPKHTFRECALATIERDKAKRSTSWFNVKTFAMKHLENIMDKDIASLELLTIQNEFDRLRENKLSKPSLNACKMLCSEAFKYAVIHKYISINDDYTKYIDASSIAERSVVHTPFTREEIEILVNDDSIMSKVIRTYILTGCRASELLNAKLYDGYMICGVKTEAGKNRKVPIHSHIEPFIQEVLNYLSGLTYIMIRDRYQEYCETNLNGSRTLHDTRNTFATLGKEAEMKSTAIKRLSDIRLMI